MKQDADSVYYWTVNGNYLTDASGNKLRVSGEKGEKGDDGVAPQVRISNGNIWQLSTDGGKTWADMTDASGNKVKATGEKGADGRSGSSGDSFFRSVNVEDSYVDFTLSNGDQFTVPRGDGVSIKFASEELFMGGSHYTANIYGLTADNFSAVSAEVKSNEGSVSTVTTSLGNDEPSQSSDTKSVSVVMQDYGKATVYINGFNTSDNAILKLTVHTKDNKQVSATALLQAVKAPDLETKEDGKKVYNVSSEGEWIWLTNNYKVSYNIDTIKLVKDLDFKGTTIKPLSETLTDRWGNPYLAFRSSFDGGGHTISNFVINNTENAYAGLFGCVEGWSNTTNNGAWYTIKNLTIDNADVTGKSYVGVVIGYVKYRVIVDGVTVKNSKAKANSTSGYPGLGGICGKTEQNASDEYIMCIFANCRVENCTLTGKDKNYIHEIVGSLSKQGKPMGDTHGGKYNTWDVGTTYENVNIVVSE